MKNTSGSELLRCPWANTDPLLRDYHDREWGTPVRNSRAMWECLMLEGFQAGLSWLVVLRKREAFRRAFRGFDPKKVATFREAEIETLMANEGIIRSRAKIEATIRGARIFLEMEDEGGFGSQLWEMAGGQQVRNETGAVLAKSESSERLSKYLHKRGFRFVGPVIVYAWMQAIGMVDDHAPECFRHHARRS